MNRSNWTFVVLLTLISLMTTPTFAQKVESKKYEKMLDRRLPKDVLVIAVNEVDTSDQTIVFLDAREQDEYNVSHIKNARHVGYKDLNLDGILRLPKSTEIIVYCSVGYRSGKVTKKLEEAGFENVKNLYGGLFEWSNQEMPLVDNDGNPTDKIHPYNSKWGKWITSGKKSYE